MRKIYIDLENTLVTPLVEWDEWMFINETAILKKLDEIQPDRVGIFSFAIQTDKDVDNFNIFCKRPIEAFLGCVLETPPKVSDIISVCQFSRPDGTPVGFQELHKYWGKSGAFKQFVRNKYTSVFSTGHTPQQFWLLDDEVENESFDFKDRNIRGELIRIVNR